METDEMQMQKKKYMLGSYLVIIEGQFLSVLHKNVCCGYTLEPLMFNRGDSKEYPQHVFYGEISLLICSTEMARQ